MLNNSDITSKQAFDSVVRMTKEIEKPAIKTRTSSNSEPKSVRIRIPVGAKGNAGNIMKELNYTEELHQIVDELSKIMYNTKLSDTELLALKSFISAIRGLQNSGNLKSAYIVAKNAASYVSGASYPYEKLIKLSAKHLTENQPEVEVKISETAKLYKPFASEHITMVEENEPALKGAYLNKTI